MTYLLSYAHQTKHIFPRIANVITSLEILFSNDSNEISHQLSERIAWYLEPINPEEREKIYVKTKKLYNERSKILHGVKQKKTEQHYRDVLFEAEELLTKILNSILTNKQMECFSVNKNLRDKELKKLSLGVPSIFTDGGE